MKSAPFEYLAATSVAEVVTALTGDDGAKILAGGQSLMPLLAMRLARPTLVVDINGLGLDAVVLEATVLRLGALVRHRRLERDQTVARVAPVLSDAARLIGHPAIRNRGSIGGSLAHADPAAELPAVLVATGGTVVAEGPRGSREVAELFDGFLTTTLEPDELLVEVRIPVPAGRAGGAFCEWAPRCGDFAEVGVAVTVTVDPDGILTSVGAAACGVGSVPIPLDDAFAATIGVGALSPVALSSIAAVVAAECAGAEGDRAALAGLLAARALVRAMRRA